MLGAATRVNGIATPVTRGDSPSLEKCVGHCFVCITVVFVHAIDVKFSPPQKIFAPWCHKLVAGLGIASSVVGEMDKPRPSSNTNVCKNQFICFSFM